MATPAISGSSSTSGLLTERLRVQQAQRTAEQAETTARALSRQATAAQREADLAQEDARTLKVRSDQAQSNAGQARQQVVSLESVKTVQQGIDSIRSQIATTLQSQDTPPAASINAEGQTTGTLVNVTA